MRARAHTKPDEATLIDVKNNVSPASSSTIFG